MKPGRWFALIKSTEPADRAEAADMLPEGKTSRQVVDALLVALDDEDALVRTCAADTIGEIDDERVRTSILERMGVETDDLVRAHLLSSLAAMNHPEDLAVLVTELNASKSSLVRLHAAYGLILSSLKQAMQVIVGSCDASDLKEQTKAFSAMVVVTDVLSDTLQDIKKIAEDHHEAVKSETMTRVARDHVTSILKRLGNVC